MFRVEHGNAPPEKAELREGEIAEPVAAPGHGPPVVRHGEEHHPKPESKDRKVDLIAPHAQPTDHQRQHRRPQEPRGQGGPQGCGAVDEGEYGEVGPCAKKTSLAEGEQPRIAEEQVEAHGEEAHGQDFGQDDHPVHGQKEGRGQERRK